MSTHYNFKNIRAFLSEGFTDEDLRRLCYDIANFRPVYDQLAHNSGKAEIIDRLLEYSDRTLQIETLLALAKEHNPVRYEKHQPYYNTITSSTSSREVYTGLQKAESKKDKIWWLPQVWWVPIIVALIGLAGVIILLMRNTDNESPTLQDESPTLQIEIERQGVEKDTTFVILIHVQTKGTGEDIPNAKITIEVIAKAPLDEITDTNGFARIFIAADRAGQPAKLIVEATGYKPYTQNIDLTEGNLPDVIQLEPAP